MSKRQNQHPRTDRPPFRLCLSPRVRQVRVVSPRTLAPSVSPLAMGRGAGEERLAWPSPTTPALPCFACPLVEAPLPWGAASRQRSGPLTYLEHLPASARWWCQLGTYSHTEGKHQAALSLSLRIPAHTGRKRNDCFCPSWQAHCSLLLQLWTRSKLYFALPFPESPC